MANRYYSEPPINGNHATLVGSEAHHLIHVMRAGPGDRVVLFDGSGAEFTARVERVSRGEVELAILSREEVDREPPVELVLGVALPKGDRQRWLVEKAVELGVRRLVPLVTGRSVARVGPEALARLRRTVIEASKQCGRNRLMEIAEPQSWSDFIAATHTARCRLLAHPESRVSATTPSAAETSSLSELSESELPQSELSQAGAVGQSEGVRKGPPLPLGEGRGEGTSERQANNPHPNPLPEGEGISVAPLQEGEGISGNHFPHGKGISVYGVPEAKGTPACSFPGSLSVLRSGAACLAAGPEGGFTPDEVNLAASAGWQLVDLGPRTLRIETAAVLLIAMVLSSVQET